MFSIRKAVESDYDFIDKTFCEINKQHFKMYPYIFKNISSQHYDKNYYNEIIAGKMAYLFIAELNGEKVGYIECVKRTFDYREKPIMFINGICVLEKFRNKGIGERLVDKVVELAKLENYFSVELNVYEGNNAKNFYEKLGFSVQKSIMEKKI